MRVLKKFSDLPDEIVQILVGALVGDLSQTGFLRRESIIQIKELQLGIGELPEKTKCWCLLNRKGAFLSSPEGRRKYRGLQRRQRRLKLRRDELEGLMFDGQLRVGLDGVGNEVGRDGEEARVEQAGKVMGNLFSL